MDLREQKKQSFPNYLLANHEFVKQKEENEMQMEASLPFHSRKEKPALTQQNVAKEPVFKKADTFREQSRHISRKSQWQADTIDFSRRRFTPTQVPSALKGMSLKQTKKVDYPALKKQLEQDPEELLTFVATEESLLNEQEWQQVSAKKQQEKQMEQLPVKKTIKPKQKVIQETLVSTLPQAADKEALEPLVAKKNRKAMKRSLSWLMDQEEQTQGLPYGKQS